METILQRMVWNTRGWLMPSGSTDEKGFPLKEGFGHEEWNFQLEDAFKGDVYGYTYSKPARIESADSIFRIVFFAIHPETKDKLAVGIYHKARLITDEQYRSLLNYFTNNGIIDRRATELREATSKFNDKRAIAEVKKSITKHWLSVCCPVTDVEIFPRYVPIETIAGGQTVSHRFRRFTYLKTAFRDGTLSSTQRKTPRQSIEEASALSEDAYYRESPARLKIIIPRHKKLSNYFCAWLKAQYKIEPKQEQQRVDVGFIQADQFVLAELKVCYGVGTTKAIREALGQLLEYNHYPQRARADLWLIVLDDKPSPNDRAFIDELRGFWKLPVNLGWKTGDGFSFHHGLFGSLSTP